jgi:hypothetical protein
LACCHARLDDRIDLASIWFDLHKGDEQLLARHPIPAHLTDIKTLKAQLGLIATVALLAVPSAAAAQPLVPPGNSAVNQYTETFPTAKGAAKTKKRGKQAHSSPAKVLGSDNARRLQAKGPVGREVAAVVAATAPPASDVTQSGRAPRADSGAGEVEPTGEGPSGSSGFGEVISRATGSSDSGDLGVVLPLLILGAFVCSAVYLWRQRRQAAS